LQQVVKVGGQSWPVMLGTLAVALGGAWLLGRWLRARPRPVTTMRSPGGLTSVLDCQVGLDRLKGSRPGVPNELARARRRGPLGRNGVHCHPSRG
jgi:hypothetical protein